MCWYMGVCVCLGFWVCGFAGAGMGVYGCLTVCLINMHKYVVRLAHILCLSK